ncbi:MAG: hypothetical protein DVB27_05320 [Verrucomicrobia bacterium]|nr:MAG: hypothetical protein DVB27_05320 [Verrucomicrobiota bacterium]
MVARLTLLIFLLVGLAFGPVRGAVSCGKGAGVAVCHACCADPAAACCAIACGSEKQAPPVQAAPTADDAKQLSAPHWVLVGLRLVPVVERPAVYRRQAARMPVVARLDLLCTRLI